MPYFYESHAVMPWENIDNVVFDIGNVLLTFDPEKMLDQVFGENTPLKAELLRRVFRSPYWLELDRGTLTDEEAAERMTQEKRELLPAVEQVLTQRKYLKEPIEEGIFALKRCKQRKKRAYVLSNYHKSSFEYVLKKFDFFSDFDGYVISYALHVLKPEQEIYQELLARYTLDPKRTLFLDDVQENVDAAQKMGIQGFLVQDYAELRRFFDVP